MHKTYQEDPPIYAQLMRELDFDPEAESGIMTAYVRSDTMPVPARYRGPAPDVVVTDQKGQAVIPFQTGTPRPGTKTIPNWNTDTRATPAVMARRRVNGL